MLYAFDRIGHKGKDPRNLGFLDRRVALARLLRDAEAGILLNEHVADDGATVFARPAGAARLLVFGYTWVPELQQP
jgi:hypothetical protein